MAVSVMVGYIFDKGFSITFRSSNSFLTKTSYPKIPKRLSHEQMLIEFQTYQNGKFCSQFAELSRKICFFKKSTMI